MILTEQLTKVYRDVPVVHTLDLRVPEGSIYGFLGPNGSGKSTTLKMLLGLEKPTRGRITLNGHDLFSNRRKALQKVGAIIEHPALYPHLTARENLLVMCQLLDLPISRIEHVLQQVELTGTGSKLVRDFSMGMKQRLGIASALLQEPRLLILDEPTNGLDVVANQRLKQLLLDLNRQGVTLLITSHILSDMEALCTDVGLIYNGKLTYQGSLKNLLAEHQTTATIRTSDNQRARQLLGQLITREQESDLVLDTLDEGQLAHINRQLVQDGLDVFHLSVQHRSLESIFHQLLEEARP